jgi:hypothetical protein
LPKLSRITAVEAEKILPGVEKPGFCCKYQSYLFIATKKPGFWGFLGLSLGERNRVSVVDIKVICLSRQRNPVSGGFWGDPWGRETGFLFGISKLSVFRDKETRFLGVSGVIPGGEKPGFCCGYQSYLFFAKKKPGFWGFLG